MARRTTRKASAAASETRNAAERTGEMLALAESMISGAIDELTRGVPLPFDPEAQDRRLGEIQRSIRRRIVAHLHEHPADRVLDCATRLTLLVFIERLGDYAKNLHEVAARLPRPFADLARADTIAALGRGVLEMFRLARTALTAEGEDEARRAIALHGEIAARARSTLDALLREEGTDPREAVATALAVRYLKRTSSHLMNLASTVVTAFDEIGYHPGGAADAPPGDEPSGP